MVASRKSRKRVLKSTGRTRVAKSKRLKRVKTRRRVHKRKMKRKRMSKRRRRGGVDSEDSPSYTRNVPNQQVAPSYEVSQSLASERGTGLYASSTFLYQVTGSKEKRKRSTSLFKQSKCS